MVQCVPSQARRPRRERRPRHTDSAPMVSGPDLGARRPRGEGAEGVGPTLRWDFLVPTRLPHRRAGPTAVASSSRRVAHTRRASLNPIRECPTAGTPALTHPRLSAHNPLTKHDGRLFQLRRDGIGSFHRRSVCEGSRDGRGRARMPPGGGHDMAFGQYVKPLTNVGVGRWLGRGFERVYVNPLERPCRNRRLAERHVRGQHGAVPAHFSRCLRQLRLPSLTGTTRAPRAELVVAAGRASRLPAPTALFELPPSSPPPTPHIGGSLSAAVSTVHPFRRARGGTAGASVRTTCVDRLRSSQPHLLPLP